MEYPIIIFHWKYFDLYQPLSYLRKVYGKSVEPRGLISAELFGAEDERGQSFLAIPRISENRLRFYDQCLDTLKQQYNTEGFELHTSDEPCIAMLRKLADQYENVDFWLPYHLGYEEANFIESLRGSAPANISFKQLPANTLIREDELPLAIEQIPNTFSRFRKSIEKRKYRKYQFSKVSNIFPLGSSPGRQRLESYIFTEKHIVRYKQTRNGLGQGDYSSRLSKWLATGMLSATEAGAAILRFEREHVKNSSTYWLLFELLWRDYFHYLHRRIGNTLFHPMGMKKRRSPGLQDSIAWKFPGSNYEMLFPQSKQKELEDTWQRFRTWGRAQTGNEFIDAIMAELYFTGEISNRARQCAASYLIYDLKVPWWWGAQWFEYLLLDYDVSSNWGNWAYIAGVGADTKPQRHFNIEYQAKTHDPDRSYRNWVAKQNWLVPEEAMTLKIPASFY